MKNQKYNTIGTVQKSNRKIVERGTIDTPSTQLHDLLLSWLGKGTSIKKWWDLVKLVKNAMQNNNI